MKTIEVTISAAGAATVETKGFAGTTCTDASKFLEQALGRTTADRKTVEYFRPAEQRAEACQQN